METITESEYLSPDDSCWRSPAGGATHDGDNDSLEGAIVGGCLPCLLTEGATSSPCSGQALEGCGGAGGATGTAAVEVVTNGNDPFLGKIDGL